MAAWSKEWVYDYTPAGIVGSNQDVGIEVCVS
jgi:hypothetical protein